MKKRHLTLKVFILIILDGAFNMIAQLLMKKGLVEAGAGGLALSNVADFVGKNISSPFVLAGIIMYAMNFLVWIVILYKVDLSIALPAGGIGYVFAPLAAIIFLHEQVGLVRWVGIGLIVAGVHFVSRSSRPPAVSDRSGVW